MAVYFVDHNATGGDGLGGTWEDAFLDFSTAMAAGGAGDIYYVSSAHAETNSSTQTVTALGTYMANPPVFISATALTGTTPPTAFTRGASMTVTGSTTDINLQGGVYIGIDFKCSDIFSVVGTEDWTEFYDCTFELTTNSADKIELGLEAHCRMYNCGFKFNHIGQHFKLEAETTLELYDCYFVSGTTAPTYIFWPNGGGNHVESYGLDLTNLGASATTDVFKPPTATTQGAATAKFVNTHMPTTWGGTPMETTSLLMAGERYEFFNLSDSDTMWESFIYTNAGTIIADDTIYNVGTYDGTNAYSWQMINVAGAEEGVVPLSFKLVEFWADANATIAVKLTCANTLTNQDFWVVIEHPNASDASLSVFTSSRDADYFLGSGAALTTDATWSQGALSEQYKVEQALTSQAGVHRVWVYLASDAAETVYVDPEPVIT